MTDAEVEQLLRDIQPSLRHIASGFYQEPDRIDDMVQEHSAKAWANRGRLDKSQNPRSYLIAQMYFLCQNQRRTDGRDKRACIVASETPLEEQDGQGCESSHLRDLEVRRAFDALGQSVLTIDLLQPLHPHIGDGERDAGCPAGHVHGLPMLAERFGVVSLPIRAIAARGQCHAGPIGDIEHASAALAVIEQVAGRYAIKADEGAPVLADVEPVAGGYAQPMFRCDLAH